MRPHPLLKPIGSLLCLLLLPALQLEAQAQESKPPQPELGSPSDELAARKDAIEVLGKTGAAIAVDDAITILRTLAAKRYEGRGTGLKGELKATAFIAELFEGIGLKPEGDDGAYFQRFPFPTGFEMGADNHAALLLEIDGAELKELSVPLRPDIDYLPVAFGATGEDQEAAAGTTPIVFAGYGIRDDSYDSFEDLEVRGKWIAAFRGVPGKNSKKLQRSGSLVAKASLARELGAAGILYIKGFNEEIPSELVPLDTPLGKNRILPALSISNQLSEMLLTSSSTDGNQQLKDLYQKYDSRETVTGFETSFALDARIDLDEVTSHGRNVLARLQVGDAPSEQVIMIGAHADHVGFGNRGGSLATGLTANRIHPGADDNASGISALIEIAQHLADLHQRGELNANRDIVFAAWTGEEMGLIGSRFWVEQATADQDRGEDQDGAGSPDLRGKVAAYLNMDMVGRVRENKLKIQGTGSSPAWPDLVDACSSATSLDLEQEPSPHIPTDVASFTAVGVPILAAFSGLHPEYHTPGDTPGKVNFDGLVGAADFMAEVLLQLARDESTPEFTKFDRRGNQPKVVIGFVPEDSGSGISASQIVPGSAAEKAGLQVGDILLELNREPVTDMGSLQKILLKLEPEKSYPMRVRRGAEGWTLKVIPRKR
ncbi:MAG: M28 family peptidase [Verrucomicrobiales bacterium]